MRALLDPLVALFRFDVASEPFSGVGWQDPLVPVSDDPLMEAEACDGEACRSMAAERNQRPDRGEGHVPGEGMRSDAPVVLERGVEEVHGLAEPSEIGEDRREAPPGKAGDFFIVEVRG